MTQKDTKTMRHGMRLFAALAFVALAGCGVAADGGAGDQDTAGETTASTNPVGPLLTIRVAGIEIDVEIADDDSERARGLMFRESLPPDQGMLFVYETERTLGFWMKNTLIPLDIAYADAEGRIVDIQRMTPQTTTTYDSAAPAQFALEMNSGWFAANGVEVGDLIEYTPVDF